MSGVPMPTRIFMVSSACSEPMMPQSAPSTPASPQFGTAPAGGGAGNRQRWHGPPRCGAKTATWPSNWWTLPKTRGRHASTAASLAR